MTKKKGWTEETDAKGNKITRNSDGEIVATLDTLAGKFAMWERNRKRQAKQLED